MVMLNLFGDNLDLLGSDGRTGFEPQRGSGKTEPRTPPSGKGKRPEGIPSGLYDFL